MQLHLQLKLLNQTIEAVGSKHITQLQQNYLVLYDKHELNFLLLWLTANM